MGDVTNSVLPKTAIVIKPDQADIKSRYFMPWDCHPAYAVTGSMALLGACKSKDTICSEFYDNYSDSGACKTNTSARNPVGRACTGIVFCEESFQ